MTVALLLVTAGLLLILLSELLRMIGFMDTSFMSGIQKTMAFAIIFMGFLIALTRAHMPMERAGRMLAFFSILTIVSTFFGVTPDIAFWRQAVHLTLFISAFFTFYIGTETMGLEETAKYIKLIYVVVAFSFIFAIISGRGAEGNVVYYLFLFLPATEFFKSRRTQRILYLFQIFAVLISNKRTALIALVAYLLCYEWLSNKTISGRKRIYKLLAYIVLAIAVFILYPIVISKLGITVFDELSVSHIAEDGGSNRLYIYAQLWQAQMGGSLQHWLIGSGYNSVLLSQVCTDGALGAFVSGHNDLLEVIYDYGIVGTVSYIAFFIFVVRRGLSMVKTEYQYSIPFFSSLLLALVISVTSHLVIYLNYYAIMMAFWAICLADHAYGGDNSDYV